MNKTHKPKKKLRLSTDMESKSNISLKSDICNKD